jgi:tRNA G18 (ribose-2'-O)-methylase SpoU
MPIEPIDSFDDPRLEPYRQIKRTNATRWAPQFIAEGEKLVRRLIETGWPLHSLLVGQQHLPDYAARIPADVPLYVVPDDYIEPLVGFNFHRGILACGVRRSATCVADLVPAQAKQLRLVVCVDVHDPVNLGSIIRTSVALGVDGLILSRSCADPFSRRVLRVSMGTVLRLPLFVSDDLPTDLDTARSRGQLELWGTALAEQASPLQEVVPPNRWALLLGNEGHGLPSEILALCDRLVTIPMADGVDSLNVSVTAGIVLYELLRTKKARPTDPIDR